MKRARPPDDLNGMVRAHKAKRSKREVERSPDLGPITAMIPELRQRLYTFMDVQSLGRLAQTCRGFRKDLSESSTSVNWIPTSWAHSIATRFTVHERMAVRSVRRFIHTVLRPARFFAEVYNAGAVCGIQPKSLWSAYFTVRGTTHSIPSCTRPCDGDESTLMIANWMRHAIDSANKRHEKEKARRSRPKVPTELRQRHAELLAAYEAQRNTTMKLRLLVEEVLGGVWTHSWSTKLELVTTEVRDLYRIKAELDQADKEIVRITAPTSKGGDAIAL